MPYRLTIILFLLLFALLGYLLGSVNFAILVTRWFTGRDVRNAGSGNAGMTNVMRTAGFLPGVLTFLGDFLKGVAAVYLGKYLLTGLLVPLAPETVITESGKVLDYAAAVAPVYGASVSGFFCLVGHMFPLYFGFRGGKGIATTAGVMLVLDWRVFLIVVGIFAVSVLVTRIVSLSSIIAAVCYPVVTWMCFSLLPSSDAVNAAAMSAYHPLVIPLRWFLTLVAVCFTALILYKHRDNMARLRKRQEKRFSLKKNK